MRSFYHEVTQKGEGKEGILQSIISSQHFLRDQTYVALSSTPEIITTLKHSLVYAYESILLPDIAKESIVSI